MSAHTPGPWVVDDKQGGDVYRYVLAEGGDLPTVIARVTLNRGASEANARLIAAAPELYEALRELIAAAYAWVDDEDSVAAKLRYNAAERAVNTALAKVDA